MARKITILLFGLVLIAALGAYLAGSYITAPNPSQIGPLPNDVAGETVLIPSESGSLLHGWFLPGNDGVVVLLHSLHGSRNSMLGRARLLHKAGYSVLMFDFQAHGESPGNHVTFGYLESLDAQAAVEYIRRRLPGQKVGVIGTSLGGAAAILAQPPLKIEALIVEAVFPSIEQAVADRLMMRFGAWSSLLTPLLTLQLEPRLGIAPEALRPIDRVAELPMPKLFIAGSDDLHTRLEESRALFEAASAPKEFWVVAGAKHEDLYAYSRAEYERRVLGFLNAHLR